VGSGRAKDVEYGNPWHTVQESFRPGFRSCLGRIRAWNLPSNRVSYTKLGHGKIETDGSRTKMKRKATTRKNAWACPHWMSHGTPSRVDQGEGPIVMFVVYMR